MDNKIILVLFLVILLLGYIVLKPETSSETKPVENKIFPSISLKPTKTLPKMSLDLEKSYQAVLETSVGEIIIDLNASETPITVNNFVALAKKGFYNNTVFHRIILGFMIQGGDPLGNGTGGPGYTFNDEPFTGEYVRGTVAMANSGPNTNGSQFFIIQQNNDSLPKDYVIFGKVSSGIETVDKIAEAPVKEDKNNAENSIPVEPVEIKSIEIIEK